MAKVYQKFLQSLYGSCPRALCDRQKVLPVGLSDNLKVSRFKVYCPRCEEVYVPKFRSVNIDGAFFGTSFPHHFLKHYKQAVILPPKIYHYEPKIFGFKMVGKRGSKYFDPPKGNIRYNFDTMTGVDKEKIIEQVKAENKMTRQVAMPVEVAKLTNNFAANFFVTETKDAEQVLKEAVEDQHRPDEKDEKAAGPAEGKKKKKKNRK